MKHISLVFHQMDQCSIIFDNFQQSNVGSPALNGLPPNNSPFTTTNKAAERKKRNIYIYKPNSTATKKLQKNEKWKDLRYEIY